MCILAGYACSINTLNNSVRMDSMGFCSPYRGSVVPRSVPSNSFLYYYLLRRLMTYRGHARWENRGVVGRWKHIVWILIFGIVAESLFWPIRTRRWAVCTSQFNYPLRFKYPLKNSTDILCALPCSTILLNRMFSMYALILITLSLHPLFTVPLRPGKIY